MYHFPFSFEFVPVVQKFAYRHITEIPTAVLFGAQLDEISEQVNRELKFYNLPTLFSAHVFRKPAHCTQDIHKDVYFLNDGRKVIKEVAYNVPVYGCDNTFMEWFDGKYVEKFEKVNLCDNRTVFRFYPEWEDGPHLAERMAFAGPHFFKINEYHRAITGSEERVVMSLRFNDDLKIEHYYKQLHKSK